MQGNPEPFGAIEKEFRERAKITVDDFAGRIGVTDQCH